MLNEDKVLECLENEVFTMERDSLTSEKEMKQYTVHL